VWLNVCTHVYVLMHIHTYVCVCMCEQGEREMFTDKLIALFCLTSSPRSLLFDAFLLFPNLQEEKQVLELEHVVHFTAMFGVAYYEHVYASDTLLQALLLSQLPARLRDAHRHISPRKHLQELLSWLVSFTTARAFPLSSSPPSWSSSSSSSSPCSSTSSSSSPSSSSSHVHALRTLHQVAVTQLAEANQPHASPARLASLYAEVSAHTPHCAVHSTRSQAVLTVALLRALGWHARLVAWITPLSVHANPKSKLGSRSTTKLKSSYFHTGPLLISPPRRVALHSRRVLPRSASSRGSPSGSSSASSAPISPSPSTSSSSSSSSSSTSSFGSVARFSSAPSSSSSTVAFYLFVEVDEELGNANSSSHGSSQPVTYLSVDPTTGKVIPQRYWREGFGEQPAFVLAFDTPSHTTTAPHTHATVPCTRNAQSTRETHPTSAHDFSHCVSHTARQLITDITPAYCSRWSLVSQERGVQAAEWFPALLRRCSTDTLWMGALATAERAQMCTLCENEPLPTTVSAFKNHPLYVLERHLLKYQTLHPREVIGHFRGTEEVFRRSAVYTLHSAEKWLQLNRQIRTDALPTKAVPARQFARKKRAHTSSSSGSGVDSKPTELFGEWQTEVYDPPAWTEHGGVPRNRFGNVYLFFPSMCPKHCVHLPFQGALRMARRLGVDAAPAQTDWEFHRGRSHPQLRGAVVHHTQAQLVRDAHQQLLREEFYAQQREHRRHMHTLWRRLGRGVRRWNRLRARYDEGAVSVCDGILQAEISGRGGGSDDGSGGGAGESGTGGTRANDASVSVQAEHESAFAQEYFSQHTDTL
jgi:Rad4 beta-hairpin domain 3/Rad4 beta-hairpin domain 1/Rad4 beta-hairpin domain 2